MKQQIKNEQKNGTVKAAQPNVSAPVVKPEVKKEEAGKPSHSGAGLPVG